ncbi:MAG: TolC family protein [Gemmataceae bacterium]|nr:TolC family protein [Gemmataceae bacterium]
MRRLHWMLMFALLAGCDQGVLRHVVMPEQRVIDYRDPPSPPAPLPEGEGKYVAPRTVADHRKTVEWNLALDDAIRIGLENAKVVRVLTGVSATSSGKTIYDPAITNTLIDQETARFDPVFSHKGTFNGTATPSAFVNPLNPNESLMLGMRENDFRSATGLSKTNLIGGQTAANWVENPMRFLGGRNTSFGAPFPFPLNPQNRNAIELSYTQPLLQGAGSRYNTAPIVLARLNTEVSFFQYKDSVQELVRGVIEGYWNLVLARTDLWAKTIQVDQSWVAYDRELKRLPAKLATKGSVDQALVTYAQFKANLVAAQATVLTREGALRNLLGLPPNDDRELIPTSTPNFKQKTRDWAELVSLAEERRPDIIELKLILEAEQVRLMQAQNQTLPKLDAVALYRWNGLAGAMPNGERLATGPGQFTDWSVGVNFSVPLGLRQGRAKVREEKLLIVRDRANLEQAQHAALHDLAISVRDLDSAWEQYKAYKEMRVAASENLKMQSALVKEGIAIYADVVYRQALNDWGNAIAFEAGALLAYNVRLATLERQTGTILETHGLVFYEERFRVAGPLGIGRLYPSALPPAGTPDQYPGTKEPSENSFDLTNPAPREKQPGKPPPPAPEKLAPPAKLVAPVVVPAVTSPLRQTAIRE